MGYRPVSIPLDLEDFRDEDNPENSLKVRVISPSIREGERMNAGKLDNETREQFGNVCWGFLVPKIESWNLDDQDGLPVTLPRLVGRDIEDPQERLAAQVEHLRDQDENVVLAIFREWRLATLTKKADTPEGKASETRSTPGPDASAQMAPPDLRELESQIPM